MLTWGRGSLLTQQFEKNQQAHRTLISLQAAHLSFHKYLLCTYRALALRVGTWGQKDNVAWDGVSPIEKTGLVPQVINVRG